MLSKPRIPHNKPSARLSQRIAEEAQLLAEEKWIIEALRKIKAQRNGLQIERLNLESMRAKLLAKINKDQTASAPAGQTTDEPMAESQPNEEDLIQPSDLFDLKKLNAIVEDDMCNTEELNLSVTNSVFNVDPYGGMGDEEEDDEDMDNCILDIDLLMSSSK